MSELYVRKQQTHLYLQNRIKLEYNYISNWMAVDKTYKSRSIYKVQVYQPKHISQWSPQEEETFSFGDQWVKSQGHKDWLQFTFSSVYLIITNLKIIVKRNKTCTRKYPPPPQKEDTKKQNKYMLDMTCISQSLIATYQLLRVYTTMLQCADNHR